MTPVHLMWTEQNLLSFNEQLCYMKHISTLITLVYWFSQSSSKQDFIPRLHRWVPSHTSLICPTNLELFLHRQSYRRRPYAHKNLAETLPEGWKTLAYVFQQLRNPSPSLLGKTNHLTLENGSTALPSFTKKAAATVAFCEDIHLGIYM